MENSLKGAPKLLNCRSCHSSLLVDSLDLGLLASAGRFVKIGEIVDEFRLCLTTCSECGLMQLANNISANELYADGYGYQSNLNLSMVEHLQTKAQRLEAKYQNNSDGVFVDIASNDGTL